MNIIRNTILEALSGEHRGEFYRLSRVAGGKDRDCMGNMIATSPMRYAFNLFNVNTGKARQTETDRLFVTTLDGVNQGIPLHKLESHFNMQFQVATNEPVIAPKVNAAIVEEQAKSHTINMAKVLLSLLDGSVKFIPVRSPSASGGTQGYLFQTV